MLIFTFINFHLRKQGFKWSQKLQNLLVYKLKQLEIEREVESLELQQVLSPFGFIYSLFLLSQILPCKLQVARAQQAREVSVDEFIILAL